MGVTPRLFVDGVGPLSRDAVLNLPEGAARHAQVLRMQPGNALVLFTGDGLEWSAQVAQMGRKEVAVTVGDPMAAGRELSVAVTLAVGMPTNDRMDALVEKATELGAQAIQPLVCSRSVLRLDGDRAAKKVAHWRAVAVAAGEQSGRTRIPAIHPVMGVKAWLEGMQGHSGARAVLSFEPEQAMLPWLGDAESLNQRAATQGLYFLSGPEGGLSPEEEALARQTGWTAVGLGPRVLRADTAPLMALSLVAGLLQG
jgi:16S rRNA (uracil1498-N3)-methyltransferase